jgi:hypothetical protein
MMTKRNKGNEESKKRDKRKEGRKQKEEKIKRQNWTDREMKERRR